MVKKVITSKAVSGSGTNWNKRIRFFFFFSVFFHSHILSFSFHFANALADVMTTSSLGLSLRGSVATCSIRFTTDIPDETRPKIVCFPSSHGHGAYTQKQSKSSEKKKRKEKEKTKYSC